MKFKVWSFISNDWEKDECFLSENGSLFQRKNGRFFGMNDRTYRALFASGLFTNVGERREVYEGDILEVTQCCETSYMVLKFDEKGFGYFQWLDKLTETSFAPDKLNLKLFLQEKLFTGAKVALVGNYITKNKTEGWILHV